MKLGLRRGVADLMARYQSATMADMQVGRVLLEVNQARATTG